MARYTLFIKIFLQREGFLYSRCTPAVAVSRLAMKICRLLAKFELILPKSDDVLVSSCYYDCLPAMKTRNFKAEKGTYVFSNDSQDLIYVVGVLSF